ncbi:hypothetical protein T05_11884 [Trichinella murrelli]|uniref:Uncharacterized protein n=1 Tax=Trichinella murrelli TaxID=144512 RepID=A0A0V0TR66_9BILA|nr:hypothetical protein T05_11884 [Trichinella murrelli]
MFTVLSKTGIVENYLIGIILLYSSSMKIFIMKISIKTFKYINFHKETFILQFIFNLDRSETKNAVTKDMK